MNRRWVLIGLFVLQGLCALFFVSEVVLTVVGARTVPISWHLRELMELGAVIGLLLGGVLGAVALNQAVRARRHAEGSLRGVQLAFRDHMEAKFVQWGSLRPSVMWRFILSKACRFRTFRGCAIRQRGR